MGDTPFKDAEAWLAEQGVPRDPLRVPLEPPAPPQPEGAGGTEPPESSSGGGALPVSPEARSDSGTEAPPGAPPARGPDEVAPVRAREAQRLAAASADEALRRADAAAGARPSGPRLEDDVAEAVAFARRSTANAPQAEARIAAKLRARDYPDAVVEQALDRCRSQGIVDDHAMAAALVEEGRRKGHAPRRLRADLQRRELAATAIEDALSRVADADPEAAAFALAREKAATLSGVSAETAFRRVVAYLARRGHPEGLARKVAREAVFTAREQERAAGH